MTNRLFNIAAPVQPLLDRLEETLLDYVKNDVALIEEVARYVLKNGGKRLRPILTLLASDACDALSLNPLPFAAAIEFVHTASLLHDDVVDNATLRRTRPSANEKWGNTVSVLVGDYFYCRASQILTSGQNWAILTAVTDAITRTTEGEVLEITKSNDLTLSEADYLKIIYHKTAVLMGTACEVGACLRPDTEKFRPALRQFGESIGMAFQLADDVLDYVANDAQFGKQNGTDLQEGRLTLPLIYTLEAASPNERSELKALVLAKELNVDGLNRATELMKTYDAPARAMNKARDYLKTATHALNEIPDSASKRALLALADYVIDRTY